MKKKIGLKSISVALILAIAALAVAFNFYSNVAAQSDTVKAVTDVLISEAAAIEKGDLAALDKIWATDDSVTVFESGHANYGWTDYRNNHLAPELKEFKNTKYAFSDVKVKTSGNLAFATFKYTLSADLGKRRIDAGGLATAVLEKQNGQWHIVHWHSSAPRRAANAQAPPASAQKPSPQ